MGVSEEFVGGPGTFEEDGKIYAVAAGASGEDSQRRLAVGAPRTVRPLAHGDLVYGIIQDLYDSIALVEFALVPQQAEKSAADSNSGKVFPASESRMAFLRISELTQGYVERLRDHIRIGDMLRARILEVKSLGIYLTIKDRDLGVVRAFCSYCRTELVDDGREFKCSYCGSQEQRKAAEQQQ